MRWIALMFAKRLKRICRLRVCWRKLSHIPIKVGFSERTDVIIEPKLSMQWFLKMEDLAQPALKAVMNDDIKLYPPKFKNTVSSLDGERKGWCISRQLWWGHRILPGSSRHKRLCSGSYKGKKRMKRLSKS